MRILGIDFGMKQIGLALGDTESKIAVPLETLINNELFWDVFLKLVQHEKIDGFVLGVPLALRDGGGAGEAVEAVEDFKKELESKTSLPIYIEDERMSSKMADRMPGGTKKDRDAVAASLILQSYLDRLND